MWLRIVLSCFRLFQLVSLYVMLFQFALGLLAIQVVAGCFGMSYVGMNSSVAPLWFDLFHVALDGSNLFQVIFV